MWELGGVRGPVGPTMMSESDNSIMIMRCFCATARTVVVCCVLLLLLLPVAFLMKWELEVRSCWEDNEWYC